jgi:hypothetical protein
MTGKVAKGRRQAKNANSRIRNQNPQIRNQISPVMQKMRDLLPAQKAAQNLALLIDEPLSTCQKLLCGERSENSAILTKLLQSIHGREVLFVLMGDERPDWFSKYRKQLDVNAARRQLRETERAIERLQQEAAE